MAPLQFTPSPTAPVALELKGGDASTVLLLNIPLNMVIFYVYGHRNS
jgi:hypothetical protein